MANALAVARSYLRNANGGRLSQRLVVLSLARDTDENSAVITVRVQRPGEIQRMGRSVVQRVENFLSSLGKIEPSRA